MNAPQSFLSPEEPSPEEYSNDKKACKNNHVRFFHPPQSGENQLCSLHNPLFTL